MISRVTIELPSVYIIFLHKVQYNTIYLYIYCIVLYKLAPFWAFLLKQLK